MSIPMTTEQILDREYLEIRAKILQIAASFDRLDRGAGSLPEDHRWQLLQQGLQILQTNDSGKAEQVQMLFSLEYDDQWRGNLGVDKIE